MKTTQYSRNLKITKDMIEAFQFYYGGSKKNAVLQLAQYTEDARKYLIDGYNEQLKRAFYED